MDAPDDHPEAPLEAREPSVEDLVSLCRKLNAAGARYLVVGGFAIRAAGYDRRTMDIDLLVDVSGDNESRVLSVLRTLPDGAASELRPGEISEYSVVRVADEIVVDLMSVASGIDYATAAADVTVHEVDGVGIPCASPRLLYRMKCTAGRDKDQADIAFLAALLSGTDRAS